MASTRVSGPNPDEITSWITTTYAALDRILPHPVYAKQRWLAILNPSRETFDGTVKPLIAEARARLAGPRRPGRTKR